MSSPNAACSMAMSAAAMAYWMKRSICRSIRLGIQRVASKSRTSPAMVVLKSVVSKRVMGPMPDSPARSLLHVSSVPTPSGVTNPMPVIATLRRDTLLPAPRPAAKDATSEAARHFPTWVLM